MDLWNDNCDSVGCAAKPAPEMALWRNFFSEPVFPKSWSQELSLGYAGNVSVVILGNFQGSLYLGFDRFPHLRHGHSHIHGKTLHQTCGAS